MDEVTLPQDTEVVNPVYLVPFVPSSMKVVRETLELAGVGEKDVFVDLGAGDGRVVVEAAKKGALAVGVELREKLIEKARRRIAKEGLDGRAKVVKGDLFRFGWIRNATVIYMFLDPKGVEKVKELLEGSIKPGTKVISISYKIPGWEPEKIKKVKMLLESRTIYLYRYFGGQEKELMREKEVGHEARAPKTEGASKTEEPKPKEPEAQTSLRSEGGVREVLELTAKKYGIELKPSMTLREELREIINSKEVPEELRNKLVKLIQEYERSLYKGTQARRQGINQSLLKQ